MTSMMKLGEVEGGSKFSFPNSYNFFNTTFEMHNKKETSLLRVGERPERGILSRGKLFGGGNIFFFSWKLKYFGGISPRSFFQGSYRWGEILLGFSEGSHRHAEEKLRKNVLEQIIFLIMVP